MPSSVNILVPPKKGSRRPKAQIKPAGPKEKKPQTPDVAVSEVPAKRETTKKERKKFNASIRKKEAPKKSVRKRKSTSGSADNHEAPTPSIRSKKMTTPTPSDDKIVEKKRDEGSKIETKINNTTHSNSKKFNMELAQKFFKQMAENQKGRPKTIEEDLNIETMPESSSVKKSSSKLKKMQNRKNKQKELDPNIFKENGEPVWVIPDRKPSEMVTNEDGELVKYPELMAALEEEGLEMEDGKGWFQKITSFLSGELNSGKIDLKEAKEGIDPWAPFEVLNERSDQYFKKETVVYITSETVLNLCDNAIERFSQQEDTGPRRPPPRECDSKKEGDEEKTCIVTSIAFNTSSTFKITYDRRCPIESIRKFKQRYRDELKLSEAQEKAEKDETNSKKEDANSKKEEVCSKKERE
ncbi:unnamed protein product [Caenorhabditis brenneri]